MGAVVQTWTEQGDPRFQCAEVSAGGCDNISHGSVPPNGVSETFWYDREDRLVTKMDPEGAYATYGRDERGWVKTVTHLAAGEVSRLMTLTLNDDGAWTFRARGAVGGGNILTESRTYDGLRRLETVTDTQGRNSVVRHTARDVVASVSTAGQWTVRYVRDEFARVTERWVNGTRTARYSRMPGGRVWKREALGETPEFFAHDESGRVVFARQGDVTSVHLSPSDRRFSATARLRNRTSIGATTVERTHDVLGDVIAEREVGFDGTSSPPMRSSTYLRDDNGYLRGATDPQGATSEFVPDLLGRVLTERLPINGGALKTTTYTWNRRGALLTRSDPRGAGMGLTVQEYTGFGEPFRRTVPGGTSTTPRDVVSQWTYDEVGRLKTEHMGPAQLRFDYANDRVWRVRRDGTETVLRQYGYDGLGRLSSATNYNHGLTGLVADPERVATTSLGYDALGRRSLEMTQVGTRAARSTSSTWSLSANGDWIRQVGRPDGQTAREAYDGLGRLAEMERPWTGQHSNWEHNAELLELERHGNAGADLTRSLAYDGFSQLKNFTWAQGSQRPYESSFLRDKLGRVVSANRIFTKTGSSSDKGWRGYKYQQSGALEVVFEGDDFARTGGLDPTDTTWAQVEALAPAVPAARYEYTRDAEGSPLQILRVDIAGQTPRFESPSRTRGFQAEWVELDGATKRFVSHDTAGRVTQEFGRTNTFDDFHSLVAVEVGSLRQAFQYDGLGRLLAARSGPGWDVEEEVAYDGQQMVAAWNGAASLTWSAVWGQGIDNLIAVRPTTDGTEQFALKDGKGSVVGYYRPDGPTPGLVVTADYTPEGRMKSKDWASGTTCEETGVAQCGRLGGLPFGFHSAYKSPAHGLLYFRNRWYSAESGQWLTHDPLGEVDSANLYAFNGFDPINHRDPLEHRTGSFTT
jgi:RHS repeat-associated protein